MKIFRVSLSDATVLNCCCLWWWRNCHVCYCLLVCQAHQLQFYWTNTEQESQCLQPMSIYRRPRGFLCTLETTIRQYDFVMHHMTTKRKLISDSHWVWNFQRVLCSSPSTTDPPNRAYQALLHFLQHSFFFVKAWTQEVHLSLPKAFNERDTQRAWNVLQVLSPAKELEWSQNANLPSDANIHTHNVCGDRKPQRWVWTSKIINCSL